MTHFLIVRHGYSASNESGCFTGRSDAPLTPLGIAQAQRTAEYLARFSVDRVISSPLQRALGTARPIADACGTDVVTHAGLIEIDGGAWEGKPFAELRRSYADDYELWLHNIGRAHCTGGESMRQVRDRAMRVLNEIASSQRDGCIVLCTHAGVIRAMQCALVGAPLDEMQRIPWVPNASVTAVDCEDGRFAIRQVGDTAHLIGLETNLPSDV